MYWQQASYQQQLYSMFRDDILNLALSRFRWHGLPETCDARYLEWVLLTEGAAAIAFPKERPGTFLTLKAVQQDGPNMYDNPRSWRCMGASGKTNFIANWRTGVWIWENQTRYPLLSKINVWARELADIITTKQINRFHMRMPFVLTGPQDRALDVQNFFNQIMQGQPVILGYDGLLNDVQMQATMPDREREYIGDKLDVDWENTWNAIYKMLGIDALPYKEERMIEDEVSSVMEPTEISRLGPLESRRWAVRKLNERFGKYLDGPVSVTWNHDLQSDDFDLKHSYSKILGVMNGGGVSA